MKERETSDSPTPEPDPSEQTWGQGEGAHEPTIEPEKSEPRPTTYSDGTATELEDPDAPLARDDEGLDR